MDNLVTVNDSVKQIDNTYFNNYGGGDYSKTYRGYTFSSVNILNQLIDNGIGFETMLDAGCASGELVRDLRELGVKSFGIENNKDILKRSVVPEHCACMDLRNIETIKKGSFDVVYTNALMYLFPQEILPVLKEMHRISKKAVFLCNPFKGEDDKTNDTYRIFLATPQWWEKQFQEAGFKKITKNIYSKY